jgi:FkbM family methyltransferase
MVLLRPVKSRSVVDVHGHLLEVDEHDFLGLTINRSYEPEVTAFLKGNVAAGQTAIDLGANIGYFTLLLARLVGDGGRVVAFEPDPQNCLLLEKNVRANGYRNVTVRREAVADYCGRAPLFLSDVNPGDHSLTDADGKRNTVDVDVVTLDSALAHLRGRVHWIKMDIQGAELAALRGMQSLIESCPDLTIVTEFCPQALARFGEDPAGMLSLLGESGFDVCELDKSGATHEARPQEIAQRVSVEDGTYVNLVFVRALQRVA